MRWPGWLVFLLFVPLQIFLFLKLREDWGIWWTIAFFLLLGILGNRAARAPWITQLLFPGKAVAHETRRHVFQGILFLAAALTWLLPRSAGVLAPPLSSWAAAWPQPWMPLAFLVTLLKSAVR